MVVIYLGCLLPNTSSGTSINGTGKRPTVVPPTLLPTGVYRAGASRHCWCALTAPLHPYLWEVTEHSVLGYRIFTCHLSPPHLFPIPSAVCFCGTLLTITRTGRYPASLVFRESGLSSDLAWVRNDLRWLSLLFIVSHLTRSLNLLCLRPSNSYLFLNPLVC